MLFFCGESADRQRLYIMPYLICYITASCKDAADCGCCAGPPCFVPLSGVSAGFTKSVVIPTQYLGNSAVHPLYCMAACELMTSCVGFDLLTIDARPRCAFLDLQVFPSTSFDLDIRRC